jgi:hypothetical protein
MERATGIEPVLPAWECKFSILYFQYLQNRLEKMYVHALHTVHALPDLRVAGGRLGDGVSLNSLEDMCLTKNSLTFGYPSSAQFRHVPTRSRFADNERFRIRFTPIENSRHLYLFITVGAAQLTEE